MSKSILVIDTPKECLDCELLNGYDNSCVGGKIGYDAIYEDRIKPKWCPLKSLPQKRKAIGILNDYEKGKILGFNSCLKIILGEDYE